MSAFGASALGSGRHRTSAAATRWEPESKDPIAWRCEYDHRLHPMTKDSAVVYVEDINQNVSIIGQVRARGRHVRRMVVCLPCRAKIIEGQS